MQPHQLADEVRERAVNVHSQRRFPRSNVLASGVHARHELRPVLVLPSNFLPRLWFCVAYPRILEHNRRLPHLSSERHTRLSIARRSRNEVVYVASAAAIVPQRLSLRPRRSPPLPMLESYQTRHQALEVHKGDQPAGRSTHRRPAPVNQQRGTSAGTPLSQNKPAVTKA